MFNMYLALVISNILLFSLFAFTLPLALMTIKRMREKEGSYFCRRCNNLVAMKHSGDYIHFSSFVETKSQPSEDITYH
jgi:hypothetical protein